MKIKTIMFVPLLVVLMDNATLSAQQSEALKVAAAWNISETDEGIKEAVREAKELGFNGFIWPTMNQKPFIAECGKHGIKCFKIVEPLRKRESAGLQVLAQEEESLPGCKPIDDDYQYGGEPIPGSREILDKELVCPLDAGVVAYAVEEVNQAKQAGYDGICWDFIGYRNYRSCECAECKAASASYLKTNPSVPEEKARAMFYEQSLVDLYAKLYGKTKGIDPKFIVLCHCHPVYLPNVFYGHRLKVDYCAMTVSWFFTPHWKMDRVRDYTRRTVNGPYVCGQTVGMPMIGFYCSGTMARHRRSGERLSEELRVLREEGARSVMMCELGDILSDKEARTAVSNELHQLK